MDMDQASVFLAGSILTCMGFVVIAIAILVVNNLCAKYWKPIKWIRFEDIPPPRYIETNQMQPTVANTSVANTTV
jgi:hypothetical protein